MIDTESYETQTITGNAISRETHVKFASKDEERTEKIRNHFEI